MIWTAISGSWKHTNERIEEDVRREIRNLYERGESMASGGALGVDFLATEEALALDPLAERIKIFLPTNLDTYIRHYLRRADEGVISRKQAFMLESQLKSVVSLNPEAIVEIPENKNVNGKTYYERIDRMMGFSDKLIAFHVNRTSGTQYTINKAREKGIPIKMFIYRTILLD